ncbi:Arylsulfatase precursor [Planctomycetes bacterium Pan216]|uniref:Arylsulfatase n=1 Tax=Kolteria novifilia TaxID=2527975 RepID=A0A518B4T2_9BACT|nr:Arylsulfatase precursor [Planctomycetes bacterium Pan216]
MRFHPIRHLRSWMWAVALLLAGGASASDVAPPNIVFILVDDLAWSDLGTYGHAWHDTPNIDALAASGMRFTNAYAPAPICSASRASILTGKTVARLGFEFVTKNQPGRQQVDTKTLLQAPPLTLNLPLGEVTMAERLKAARYRTAFFGKWHVSQHHQHYLGWSPTHGPFAQGFEEGSEDFGSHPYSWKRSRPQPPHSPGQFSNDTMVERVRDFIRQGHQQPYFVVASMFFVHTPVKTRYRWLLRKYDEQIPSDARHRTNRVVYAAFVETLDHYVGEILESIDESGERSNTLVVFMSDNGGHPEYTANGPLRGSKWNLYEGGIRVPFIARWPGHVPADTTSDVPVIGYDLPPTFLEAAGSTATESDGTSLLRVLQGDGELPERSLLWHFPYYHPEKGYGKAVESIGVDDFRVSKTRPQSALRRGRYKVIAFAEDSSVELYDLVDDPSEQNDLGLQLPKVTQRLAAELEERLTAMNARRALPAGANP